MSGLVTPGHAQDNWFAYRLPEGGSLAWCTMWGDTGLGVGAQDYRTTDDGKSWSFTYQYTASSIAVDSGGLGWFPLGGKTLGATFTTDYGKTWNTYSNLSPMNSWIKSIVTLPGGHHIAIRGTSSSPDFEHHLFYESINPKHETWLPKTYTGLPDTFHFNEMVGNSKTNSLFLTIYDSVGQGTQLYRSTNYGTSWVKLALTGMPQDEARLWGYRTVTCLNNGTMFYSSYHIAGGGEWQWSNYRSTDNGDSWSLCGTGLPPYSCMYSPVRSAAGIVYTSAFGGNADAPFFNSIYRSTDDGVTWADCPNVGLPPRWATYLTITPRGTILAYTNNGSSSGIYRSSDFGNSWTLSVAGLSAANTVSVAVDSASYIYTTLPESGIYRSNNGFAWTRLTNGIPGWGWLNLRPAPDKSIYVADTIGGVYHSTDHGNTWTTVSSNLPNMHGQGFDVSTLGTLIFCTDIGVYRSTNGGATWVLATTSIPPGIHVFRLGVRSDNLMVAGSDAGPYISTDDGNTWTLHANGLTIPSCYGVGFTKAGTILLGNANTLVRSTDNGEHWSPSDSGLDNTSGTAPFHAFGVRASGRIVASRPGCTPFIYSSTDDGLTWEDGRTGNFANFAAIPIERFAVDNKNNMYAASGYGLWHATPEVVGVDDPLLPETHSLRVTPAPNPANTLTTIGFSLSQASRTELSLIDCLGREVYRTVNAYDAGHVNCAVNTSTLTTGMYRCVVRTSYGTASVPLGIVR